MSSRTSPASDIEAEAWRLKTGLLYRNAGLAQSVNVVNGTLLAYVNAILHASAGMAFVWWVCIVAVAAVRYLLARRFLATKPNATASHAWRHRYIVATAMAATTWGAGTFLFIWNSPDGARLFTGLVLSGMVAGAVPILAPVLAAFRIFALLVIVPMSAAILLQATSALHWAFGAMTVIFLAAVLESARYVHETLDASIRLGLEKKHLADDLEQARATAEVALAEHKQGEFDLELTNKRLNALIEAIPDAIFFKDGESRWLITNEPAKQLFQLHDVAWQNRTEMELADLHPEFRAAHEVCLVDDERAWEAGKLTLFSETVVGKDGKLIDFEVRKVPVFDKQGLRHALVTIGRDITARKQDEAKLRKLSQAVEQSPESIVITNMDAEIEYVNAAFVQKTGYTREEAIGKNPRILNSGKTPPETFASLWDTVARGLPWNGEFHNRRKDGSEYIEHAVIAPLREADGSITHYVAVKEDITARKVAEDEINTLAFYDPLTGLPNRRLLIDRLTQALASCTRSKRECALLFIDLDNFKTLNDTLGHDIGDMLLKQVAQRLSSCVRHSDSVARLGGDEFVVMLEDLSENSPEAAAQAKIVGEKILAMLNQPYQLASYAHHSTPSIGVTLFSNRQDTSDDLLKQADLAMYQAKAAGRNTLRFFDPEMQAVIMAHAALEVDLRDGLVKDQFLLYYQAQVIGEGRLTGVEVLLRWKHPERGMVSPTEFIQLAEETGLILQLGHWVLQSACRQMAIWASRPDLAHLTVAVNVSTRQFRTPTFVEEVLAIIAHNGINPQRLKLELTESLLADDVEDVIAKMTALKLKGVGFSLDDFGTGYSSLSYLKRLPLDQLKIDQSFVRDILTDPDDAAIAKMVIALAESMGLSVIAEGVEIEAQREFLARHGCHAFQGYLFSRPLPLKDFEEYVSRP